ncbi:MAG: hypothetical protein JXR64_06925 [Spirochaetales bacterium]|nr:hypothetical protein [Spirochaetales bacterium]
MSLILNKDTLQIQINEPGEVYTGSRFDWLGQITSIKLGGKEFCGVETLNGDESTMGQGLYNEFGIEKVMGYDSIHLGESFTKIGVGQLKKNSFNKYMFYKEYINNPIKYEITRDIDRVKFTTNDTRNQKYAYKYIKEIILNSRGFDILYSLENWGSEYIDTNEYAHNFLNLDCNNIDSKYFLCLSENIDCKREYINPEKKVNFEKNCVTFNSEIKDVFFFSGLIPEDLTKASWILKHEKSGLSIKEEVNANIENLNIWGTAHVISPEIFVKINIKPGEKYEWSRSYKLNIC